MNTSPDITDAVRSWDEQTAAIEAAPSLKPENIRTVYDALPHMRSFAHSLPLDADQLALVLAAIDRLEAAVRAKDVLS